MSTSTSTNTFLNGPLWAIYLKTALPIIFVMSMNGVLAVVDALFLGHFVGPEALAAVTLMFPMYMLVVALATLVSGGMSSLLARHLGGRRFDDARAVFTGAHGLALLLGAILIVLFLLFGEMLATLVAGGSEDLAGMGLVYLRITVFFSPLLFVLSVNSDTLRNEGRVTFMALMSIFVSLANIGFNFVFIALFEMGVAGSALGTAAAQAIALTIIMTFRFRGETELRPAALLQHSLSHAWGRILALGAPQSLSFIGLALGSSANILCLQLVESNASYEDTMSAYGIVTRVLTFGFLPLLGLSYAMQTITGNNFGASQWQRSNKSLQWAMGASFVYCVVIQIVMSAYALQIGLSFVDDNGVASEVARILPIIILMNFVSGPLMMIATHFQAIGDARRAALLGLSKPFLFAIPLTFLLSARIGEVGIWTAGPVAEGCLLVLTAAILLHRSRGHALKWGLFHSAKA